MHGAESSHRSGISEDSAFLASLQLRVHEAQFSINGCPSIFSRYLLRSK
jgi:hypothetical protein